MHYSKRKTLSLGNWGYAEGRKGYCVYSSVDSAARDMLLYMDHKKIPKNFKSITSYSRFLKGKNYYVGDKNKSKEENIKQYASSVYKHYKTLKLWYGDTSINNEYYLFYCLIYYFSG